ncbi:TIGR02679 family protein [Streptomyces adelaidensis]|uniref:TIGR02679 family protein n=1 Tax=Streptomyces adelaidensis TaxID=2796465 RepID=UPI0019039300|nr:TIGR02679 family protein [Streptomyces adelaidensis]
MIPQPSDRPSDPPSDQSSHRPSDQFSDPPSDQPSDRIDLPRLRRLLGTPELAWLLERVRRRMARQEPLTGPVSVTLNAPSDAQRSAAGRLLGRPPGDGRSIGVRLDAVDAMLRRSGACPDGLGAAVVALTGQVEPLSEARDREVRAWQEAYEPLDTLAPELADWAARTRRDGLVRRLARGPEAARDLISRTVRVLRALPCDPPVSLPAFAARTLGSAHALDDGDPLTTVVLSGVRALTGFPDGAGAGWRREAWASAGLLRDDVSSTVLTLNLRGTPVLDLLAKTGEPAVLTLRQLARQEIVLTSGTLLYICENPTVLSAAADAYGPHCLPLVCLQGQPSAAALTLLRQAHAQGTVLRYHGDFDWGGLRIAAGLLRHVPWQPWRYTAVDYRRSAETVMASAPPLTGTPAVAPWDLELPSALESLGVRVEEEAVLDDLLGDLAR